MNWINDHCEKYPPVIMSPERAEGILEIHKTCEPPCPRRRGALLRLALEPATFQGLR